MGGVWNTTEVVAFLFIYNFPAFPVGLKEPLRKSESQKYAAGRNRSLAGLGLLGVPLPGRPHQNRRVGTNGESGIRKESELLRYIFACFHEICGRFGHRQ